MAKTVNLELDSYEAANLLSLLDALWNPIQRNRHLEGFDTGDWIGQVPSKLAAAMLKGGQDFLNYEPNGIPGERTPTTREMVARCGIGANCPHCGSVLLAAPNTGTIVPTEGETG